jgi:glycogen(starch) synthase
VKILVYSRVFWPSVGGTEEVVRLLAEEFAAAGHAVVVATETPGDAPGFADYQVVRRPGLGALLTLAQDADVCLMIGMSLRAVPVLVLARCPCVVSHHIYLEKWRPDRSRPRLASRLRVALKRFACRIGPNLYTSAGFRAVAGGTGRVIRNPFDAHRFAAIGAERDRDVVFLGRLIPEKGCPDLLDALCHLRARGLRLTVTVIGDGPERHALEAQAASAGLAEAIAFAGEVTGDALPPLLARHRVMVVPSRWPEPFGIVALEGMASGCVVVGTGVGGLPDAIGPGGVIVPPGDPRAIAEALAPLLGSDAARRRYLDAGRDFVAAHAPAAVAHEYLGVLGAVARRRARPRRGVPALARGT